MLNWKGEPVRPFGHWGMGNFGNRGKLLELWRILKFENPQKSRPQFSFIGGFRVLCRSGLAVWA